MPRWLWFAPFAVLLVASGIWAFRLGWIAATLTETEVIAHYSAQYVATFGPAAQASDCVARPGAAKGVWIVVSCGTEATGHTEYHINRFGRQVRMAIPPAHPAAPEI
jgi:hypothetical protein